LDDDDWAAKIDLLVAAPPSVVSFRFGRPGREVISSPHEAGSEVFGHRGPVNGGIP
jgi:hypothetical protein